MYVVYINLLYFLSIFLFTYNKNLLPPPPPPPPKKKLGHSRHIDEKNDTLNNIFRYLISLIWMIG